MKGDDTLEIKDLQKHLRTKFGGQRLRYSLVFFGMKVVRSKQSIFISQRKYALDLLKETGKLGCEPTGTPLKLNWKQKDGDKDTLVDKAKHQRLVRKLIYLSLTRLDIAFAVSAISQLCTHNSTTPTYSQSHPQVLERESW